MCTHSSSDALNAAALLRIGYRLYPAGYALPVQYGSVFDYFKTEIFNCDVVDLSFIDSRINGLSMFGSFIERLREDMSYIEVNPKIYMSMSKIYEIYNLTTKDILEIGRLCSSMVNEEYFNGHSIWNKCLSSGNTDKKMVDYLNKLKENRWFLTSIIRLQPNIYSLRTAGNTILSYNSERLNLVDICSWLVQKEGKMTINKLIATMKERFGTNLNKERVINKIREKGQWDNLITDSVDDFINSVIEKIDMNENEDDYFTETFY